MSNLCAKTKACAWCHKPNSTYCVFDYCEECLEDKTRVDEFLDGIAFKRQGVWKPMAIGGGYQKIRHS